MRIDDFDFKEISDKLAVKDDADNPYSLSADAASHGDGHDDVTGPGRHGDGHDDVSGGPVPILPGDAA